MVVPESIYLLNAPANKTNATIVVTAGAGVNVAQITNNRTAACEQLSYVNFTGGVNVTYVCKDQAVSPTFSYTGFTATGESALCTLCCSG
jgi:hypothetical protein